MFSYIWPLVLVVLSNTVYQVCAITIRNLDLVDYLISLQIDNNNSTASAPGFVSAILIFADKLSHRLLFSVRYAADLML